jgi:hypothetical protein
VPRRISQRVTCHFPGKISTRTSRCHCRRIAAAPNGGWLHEPVDRHHTSGETRALSRLPGWTGGDRQLQAEVRRQHPGCLQHGSVDPARIVWPLRLKDRGAESLKGGRHLRLFSQEYLDDLQAERQVGIDEKGSAASPEALGESVERRGRNLGAERPADEIEQTARPRDDRWMHPRVPPSLRSPRLSQRRPRSPTSKRQAYPGLPKPAHPPCRQPASCTLTSNDA